MTSYLVNAYVYVFCTCNNYAEFFLPERRFETTVISSFMIDIHVYDESALGLSSKNNPNIISIYGWIELFEEKLPKKMGKKIQSQQK